MTQATARVIGYLAAVALGLFMAVHGTVTGNGEAVTAGIALVTVGGVATANVPRGRGDHAAE